MKHVLYIIEALESRKEFYTSGGGTMDVSSTTMYSFSVLIQGYFSHWVLFLGKVFNEAYLEMVTPRSNMTTSTSYVTLLGLGLFLVPMGFYFQTRMGAI
jgi:hypothetical protein